MDCRSLVDEVNSRNGATAQLVERRTGTPLRHVRFAVAGKIVVAVVFPPESTINADSLMVSGCPRLQSACILWEL